MRLDRTQRREDAVDHSGDGAAQPVSPAGNAEPAHEGARKRGAQAGEITGVVSIPLLTLRSADSPRQNGEDKEHIVRLADTEAPLPPILVDKRTMQVIDGMHRLMAASLQGREAIDVVFFDGREADIFLRAVEANIAHGLPLSRADRRAAAERIVVSHPHLSDRAIGHSVGLTAKTVASIRKGSGEQVPKLNARVGRDGRIHPLNVEEGRRRAAELLNQQPGASLRDIARAAGISPATVLDVRKRLERGEPVVPGKHPAGDRGESPAPVAHSSPVSPRPPVPVTPVSLRPPVPVTPVRLRPAIPSDPASAVEKLSRDPSLRSSERGRGTLRLLHVNAVAAGQLPDVATGVPPHCVSLVAELAHTYAEMWRNLARELDSRARIIDPSAARTLNQRGVPTSGTAAR